MTNELDNSLRTVGAVMKATRMGPTLSAATALFHTRRFRDDRGATAVEYGLMVALIAAVIIGAVTLLGGGAGGGGTLGLFQRVNWW
jgi:pilus assembly protein Flp/PilA